MLNHKEPKECAWGYDNERKGAYVKSLTNISKGSEIYLSYGTNKPSWTLFFNYGFVIPECDTDEI
jgi:hypothetical protein